MKKFIARSSMLCFLVSFALGIPLFCMHSSDVSEMSDERIQADFCVITSFEDLNRLLSSIAARDLMGTEITIPADFIKALIRSDPEEIVGVFRAHRDAFESNNALSGRVTDEILEILEGFFEEGPERLKRILREAQRKWTEVSLDSTSEPSSDIIRIDEEGDDTPGKLKTILFVSAQFLHEKSIELQEALEELKATGMFESDEGEIEIDRKLTAKVRKILKEVSNLMNILSLVVIAISPISAVQPVAISLIASFATVSAIAYILRFVTKRFLEEELEYYVVEQGLRVAVWLTGGVLSGAVWFTKEILEKVSLVDLEKSRESITHTLETLSSKEEAIKRS